MTLLIEHKTVEEIGLWEAMVDGSFRELYPLEALACEFMLDGYSTSEIAEAMDLDEASVRHLFRKTYLRFAIKGGDCRVKLAVFLAQMRGLVN